MRTLITKVKVYKFDELSDKAKEKAIRDTIQCELSVPNEDSFVWDSIRQAEKMETPWFAGEYVYEMHKKDIVNIIRANGYEYTVDGKVYS